MRAVLVAVGSRGDAVPFIALANRLASEGHQVVLITHAVLLPPHAHGVELTGVPSDPSVLLRGPAAVALRRADLFGLNRTRRDFAALLTSVVAATEAALEGADVLVASTFAMPAVDVARRRGVPVVRAQLWPEGVGLDGPMPLLPYSWLLPRPIRRSARKGLRWMEPLLAGFDGWWERGRLHIVPEYEAGFTTGDAGALHAYSPCLAGPGEGDPATVTGWWINADPGELSTPTQELLATWGDPWIYVGFGSMPHGSIDRLKSEVAAACRALSLRALLQVPETVPGQVEPRVHVIGAEPHSRLFPQVRAIVHHAGAGTTAAAVRAGVPSVVVPHLTDQHFWAHQLHRAGVAPSPVLPAFLGRRTLIRKLAAALKPEVGERARALADRVRGEDGTGDAVRYLDAVVRNARRCGGG